ncbi:MAG TPA: DUF1343 domain-containing protein [Saprospiraceae bacterium]|nr:DUF1343 domain-containing protein [Saprospiraceae bacterium]HMQ85256.1 DUF1343 domain-containing protein [Saprospiraceae bacterium]
MLKFPLFLTIVLFLQMACGTKSALPTTEVPVTNAPTALDTLMSMDTTIKENENMANADTIAIDLPMSLRVGAEQLDSYLPRLRLSRGVALLVNQTSTIGSTHLVDTLLALGVPVKQIFAPEHGFRGTADAGESVKNSRDSKTGLPLISLYGASKKPKAADLEGIDWVVFDIQDVGARFYTYISSMHYMMEACADFQIAFMVLDRPNPNGHYVDGPVLDLNYRSFVGMHPVPVVHGMTVGEYAQMINGEGWLGAGKTCRLEVVPCQGYHHQYAYQLPIKPSPNLPDMGAIYSYPSTCFFEGTIASEGRGTEHPFQIYGHPESGIGDYYFTPVSMPGAKYPKLEGQRCRGFNLSGIATDSLFAIGQLKLQYLMDFYQAFPDKERFFLENHFFDKLAGNATLRQQIRAGWTEEQIRDSWQAGLESFKTMRAKYLIYNKNPLPVAK